jgi:outer membrane protein
MKKTLILLLLAALGFGTAYNASAQGMKIGTVDMKKVFENYYKTKDAEQRINDARTAAKKELEDRMDSYKKSGEDIKKLNDEIQSPALSKDAKEAKTKQRDDKIGDFKQMEREIQEFQQNRQKQLEEQTMRMRSGIVDEIQKVISERVKSDQYDLVFDKSGPSMNGVPVVLYAKDSYDFTTDVVTALNRNKGKDEAPATSADSSAKTTPAASGTKPKKP